MGNRRLDSRRARSLFPQGSFFIPAGLCLYSRRAVPLFPQDWRFIPAGPASRPRAFRSYPACADGDGRDPCRQTCGPRAGRDDSALTDPEVGCRPQAAAACKLKGNPGLARTATGGLMSMSRLSMTVIPVAP